MYEEEQFILKKLLEEMGRAMIGKSRLTTDMIARSTTNQKEKLARLEKLILNALKAVNAEQTTLKNFDAYYARFVGWAAEFDEASHERKKIIICELLERIEVQREYTVNVFISEE